MKRGTRLVGVVLAASTLISGVGVAWADEGSPITVEVAGAQTGGAFPVQFSCGFALNDDPQTCYVPLEATVSSPNGEVAGVVVAAPDQPALPLELVTPSLEQVQVPESMASTGPVQVLGVTVAPGQSTFILSCKFSIKPAEQTCLLGGR